MSPRTEAAAGFAVDIGRLGTQPSTHPVALYAQAADAVVMGSSGPSRDLTAWAVRLADGAPVPGVVLSDWDAQVVTNEEGLATLPGGRDTVRAWHPTYRVAWVGGESEYPRMPRTGWPAPVERVTPVGHIDAPGRVGPDEPVVAHLMSTTPLDRPDEATLHVHAWATTWSVHGLEDYSFGAWDPDLLRWPTPEGLRWSWSQRLDGQGRGAFAFRGSESTMVHRLTLSAKDPAHPREPWATAEVLWMPSYRMVGLRVDQPQPGTLVGSVVTVDPDGQVVPATPVDLHLHHLSAFDMPPPDPRPTGAACRTTTDHRGRGRCTLTAPHGGAYQVTATVRDDLGRASQTVTRVVVDGHDRSPGRWIDPHHVLITPRDVRCPRPPDGDTVQELFQEVHPIGPTPLLAFRDRRVWERRPRGCLAPGDSVDLVFRTDLHDAKLWATVTHQSGAATQRLLPVVDGTAHWEMVLRDHDVGRVSVRAVAWGEAPRHDRLTGVVLDAPPVVTDAHGQLDLWVQPPVLRVDLTPSPSGVTAKVSRDGIAQRAEVLAWFADSGRYEALPPPWPLDPLPYAAWGGAWWRSGRPRTVRPTIGVGSTADADERVYTPSPRRWGAGSGGHTGSIPPPPPHAPGPRARPPTRQGPFPTTVEGTVGLPWPSQQRQTVYVLARTADGARGWGHRVQPGAVAQTLPDQD